MNQTNNKEDIRAALCFSLLLAVFGYILGYIFCSKHHFEDTLELIRTDTLVVVKWDTVTIEKPTERIRYVVRYDTLRTSEIVNVTDSALLKKLDSLNLTIPIEQAVYSDSTETSQYTAYISGFRAALDSININCKNTETIITNTIEIKPRRFGVGLQLGVGVSPQGVAAPYLGVGVHYRLW